MKRRERKGEMKGMEGKRRTKRGKSSEQGKGYS